MRNAMNIYKRKDGRFEGRIPLGYDDNGKIKYKYLYAKSLAEIKEKMLCAYADTGRSQRKFSSASSPICQVHDKKILRFFRTFSAER